jgi:hypothetical protein
MLWHSRTHGIMPADPTEQPKAARIVVWLVAPDLSLSFAESCSVIVLQTAAPCIAGCCVAVSTKRATATLYTAQTEQPRQTICVG